MKILIVDDSIVYRKGISLALEGVPEIEIVGTANNGKMAIDKVKSLKPDLVTLDLEMPIMDGLTAIKEIRKFDSSCHILVFSSISEAGAKITMEALSNGASDFLTKSSQAGGSIEGSIESLKKELVPKVLQFKSKSKSHAQSTSTKSLKAPPGVYKPLTVTGLPKMIGIGSSTGGPDALKKVFQNFSQENFIPILIAQHMPPFFTQQFAQVLNKFTSMTVKEAVQGEEVLQSFCYVAPGDYHMMVKEKEGKYYIELDQSEKLHFVRPAVDKLFFSMAEVLKNNTMAYIMTGMGADGALGMKALKKMNVPLAIQDEQTSTVWGMPGAVFELGVQDAIYTPEQIAESINQVNQKFIMHKWNKSA